MIFGFKIGHCFKIGVCDIWDIWLGAVIAPASLAVVIASVVIAAEIVYVDTETSGTFDLNSNY